MKFRNKIYPAFLFPENDGSWHKHIDYIRENPWTIINMRRLNYEIDRKSLERIIQHLFDLF